MALWFRTHTIFTWDLCSIPSTCAGHLKNTYPVSESPLLLCEESTSRHITHPSLHTHTSTHQQSKSCFNQATETTRFCLLRGNSLSTPPHPLTLKILGRWTHRVNDSRIFLIEQNLTCISTLFLCPTWLMRLKNNRMLITVVMALSPSIP